MNTEQKQAGDKAKDERLEAELHDAMRRIGFLIPQSEYEVARVEKELPAVSLPVALKNPQRVLARAGRKRTTAEKVVRFAPAAEMNVSLARAAREGKELTPQVERAMQRDRVTAEAEAEKHPHG